MSEFTPTPGPSGLNGPSQDESVNCPSQDESKKKYVPSYRFCEICNDSFSVNQFKRHTLSEKHKCNKLLDTLKSTHKFCGFCNTVVDYSNWPRHERAATHKTKLLKIVDEALSTVNEGVTPVVIEIE